MSPVYTHKHRGVWISALVVELTRQHAEAGNEYAARWLEELEEL